MTEQQAPFGETEQTLTPENEPRPVPFEELVIVRLSRIEEQLGRILAKVTRINTQTEILVKIKEMKTAMCEQQEPFGETDQMWVPPREPMDPLADVAQTAVERAIVVHLRHPEPAAVGHVVQNHSFVRDRAQVVRILHAYADALEQVILPAVKP